MHDHVTMWQELGLDVDLHKEVLASIDRTFKNTVGTQKIRPKNMAYFDHVLHESHGGRVAELLAGKKTGKPIIGTFCIYVPDEIAMAADVVPIALCGGTQFSVPYAEKMFPRDICPLVKSTLGLAFSKTCPYAPIKSMAVGETTCDAKKKTWDILAGKVNFHVMEIPQKKNPIDAQLWRREVRAFAAKIQELAGRTITAKRLADSIQIMNDKRQALQRLSVLRLSDPPPISGLDALVIMQAALNDEPVRFTARINALNEELQANINNGISPFPAGIKRIMVSGCPSVMGNWKIHALIEQAGAAVVIDETCTGSRYFENMVPTGSTSVETMLDALADRYMSINCACFTPNHDRVKNVGEKAAAGRIDGVIQYILQYCHGYNIEAIRVEGELKKRKVPNLKIETDYSEEDTGQIRTRIEAFLETLE